MEQSSLQTPHSHFVIELLDVVRDTLGPYLVNVYRHSTTSSSAFKERMITAIGNQSSRYSFDLQQLNHHQLAAQLDAYAVLRLALQADIQARQQIESDLGEHAYSYLEDLYELRNTVAHETKQKPVKLEDAIRGANQVLELLTSIDVEDPIPRVECILSCLIDRQREFLSPQFSKSIKRVHKTIEQVTEDQLNVLRELHGKHRAAIRGCAGSGKTLIAVQQAIRLSDAGIPTLILCQNPRLASYIRQMTEATNVDAFDFGEWIDHLLGKNSGQSSWTQYDAPSEDDLLMALDKLEVSDQDKYQAIIVDEGQDFRVEWWDVIQAALIDRETDRLYIFHDDNQILLPQKMNYPVPMAEKHLIRNCRNAGKVFEFVRRYHSGKPIPDELLKDEGYLHHIKVESFDRNSVFDAVRKAYIHSIKYLDPSEIVIISTEDGQSLLSGLELKLSFDWDWRSIVQRYFRGIIHHPEKIGMAEDFEVLAQSFSPRKTGLLLPRDWLPTEDEIEIVQTLASRAMDRLEKIPPKQSNDFDWTLYGVQLSMPFEVHDRKYLQYFANNAWVDKLNALFDRVVGKTVPLYLTAEYKGLEAGGVILFIHNSMELAWKSAIYVGASRAKYLLCVVSDRFDG